MGKEAHFSCGPLAPTPSAPLTQSIVCTSRDVGDHFCLCGVCDPAHGIASSAAGDEGAGKEKHGER
jgi:hypothetical protein